jgi:GNAT superfamily N-acetyltransferase
VNIFCLGPEHIDLFWDDYAHHLYRLERDGYIVAEEVRADLRDATYQLFGIQDGSRIAGIAVTRITGRTCEVVGAAGSAPFSVMRELHSKIEAWARDIGCSRMRLQGRKGWIRLMGYEQTGIIAEKEL